MNAWKSLPSYYMLLLVLLAAAGCQSIAPQDWKFAKGLDVRAAVGLKPTGPAPPQTPTRIVSTWTDTTLHKTGQKAMRGFGGRLLFFNNESEEPIRIDGQLVVYGFDETDRSSHDTRPTKKFVFPAQQFSQHESESKLGPSYSVWLPWDEAGGSMKNISLIARFEPAEGPIVIGDQTRHLLPGISTTANAQPTVARSSVARSSVAQPSVARPSTDGQSNDYMSVARQIRQGQFHQDQQSPNQVQLASAESPLAQGQSESTPKNRLSTSTIRLPKRWK